MSDKELVIPVADEWKRRAWLDADGYADAYARSLRDPNGFWSEQAERLDWFKRPSRIRNVAYGPREVRIRWFEDGVLNASANCLDRHLPANARRAAIIWEGDDPGDSRTLTYSGLHAEVCRLANALKSLGVRKGDRVTVYLPMVPEAAVAMLACARIGAIHSVVFAGFSPESLAGRIRDCDSTVIITVDEGRRAGRSIPLKANADEALASCPSVQHCIVLRRTGADVPWVKGRDYWYHELVAAQPAECEPERMGAEDPLFILYTSGST